MLGLCVVEWTEARLRGLSERGLGMYLIDSLKKIKWSAKRSLDCIRCLVYSQAQKSCVAWRVVVERRFREVPVGK